MDTSFTIALLGKRYRRARGIVLTLLMIFATGCASSSVHTATPVKQGTKENSLRVKIVAHSPFFERDVQGPDRDDGEEDDDRIFVRGSLLPTIEWAIRFGTGPNSDLGVRASLFGAGVDLNYAFINNDNFALSFNPDISFSLYPAYEQLHAALTAYGNVLLDVVKSESTIITLAAKPGILETDGDRDFIAGGGALFKFKLTDTFSIAPGIDMVWVRDTPLVNIHLGVHFH